MDKHFNIINKNRPGGYGGVAIFLKKNIQYNIKTIINIDPIELLAIHIKINKKSFILITIYIPPKVSSHILKEKLETLFPIIRNYWNVIFGADINISHALWENNCKKKL